MFAVIRIRGRSGIRKRTQKTLLFLGLKRINNLVLKKEDPSTIGMLKNAKDYITWGEIDAITLEKMLEKRAKTIGNKKITKEFLETIKISTIKELAKQLLEEKISLKKIGLKPVFNLTPPKKGFERKGIKKTFTQGGALGYRGKEINKLILKMI